MTSNQLLSQSTSFQENSWTAISHHFSIKQSLEMIKNGTYKARVNRLRNFLDQGDKATYDQEKRRLPAVTFSADFKIKRNRSSIASYNKILVLDIDKLSPEEMVSLKAKFVNDPYILAFWESPSKAGIKGLVNFDFTEGFENCDVNFMHSYGFKKMFDYIQQKYKISLDTSGIDLTRLCFFSYDPLLWIREDYKSFPLTYNPTDAALVNQTMRSVEFSYSAEPTPNQKFNAANKNKQSDRTAIQAIVRHLSKRDLSITDSFNNWYQIGYALANTFTHELGLKYFLALSKMDGEKFNKQGCEDMMNYCFANSMGKFKFATIVYFAKQVGYREKREVTKVDVIL